MCHSVCLVHFPVGFPGVQARTAISVIYHKNKNESEPRGVCASPQSSVSGPTLICCIFRSKFYFKSVTISSLWRFDVLQFDSRLLTLSSS